MVKRDASASKKKLLAVFTLKQNSVVICNLRSHLLLIIPNPLRQAAPLLGDLAHLFPIHGQHLQHGKKKNGDRAATCSSQKHVKQSVSNQCPVDSERPLSKLFSR